MKSDLEREMDLDRTWYNEMINPAQMSYSRSVTYLSGNFLDNYSENSLSAEYFANNSSGCGYITVYDPFLKFD